MVNLATVLRLERPLAIFDLETTGTNVDADRIVQIALTKHFPDREPIRWESLINPGVPILNSAIHKITDEMVQQAPPFKRIAPELARTAMTDVDFGGYNVEFDLKLIRAEFKRAGVKWDWQTSDALVVDAQKIFFIKYPRDLGAAFKEFVDPAGFDGAHSAGADVLATEDVLAGQLARHKDLPRTVPELSHFCFSDRVDKTGNVVWHGATACLGFGKHRGAGLGNPAVAGYLRWMLKENFPDDTKQIVGDALQGRMPVKR